MVTFGGKYVGISNLTLHQHLICLGIGSGSWLVGIVIKVFPNAIFNRIQLFREEPLNMNDMDQSLTSRMRRKSSVRMGSSTSSQGLAPSQSFLVKQISGNSQNIPSLHSINQPQSMFPHLEP